MSTIISSIIEWNNKNIGCVDGTFFSYRGLFLMTNLIYFLPLLLYFNISTVLIAIMGVISFIFHGHQCIMNVNRKCTVKLMWADVILTSSLGLVLFYQNIKNVNIYCYIVMILALIFYFYGTNKLGQKLYMVCHGLWHILTGGLLLYLVI